MAAIVTPSKTAPPIAPPQFPFARPHTRENVIRHGIQVGVFNCVLALLQLIAGAERWRDWDDVLVYSNAIGFGIWGFIELFRIPLLGEAAQPRSRGSDLARYMVLVCGGVIGGWIVGSFVGDLYCGCHQMASIMGQPNRLRTAIIFSVVAATVATYFFYSRARDMLQRERIAQAERDATMARLALLQSQLEPHMLFNTLANLRVLIGLDPARAQAMLDRLIAFLRATLTASRTQAHALGAEFERLDDYLQLMAVRMGPRLQTSFDLPDELRDTPVPPLLLQPLVENSIQHGLEPKVEGGRIEVSARREAGQLVLRVRDTGVGLEAAPASNGTRFGLKQVRERLQTLHGDAASLELEPAAQADGGGTLATLRLPV